eukprot:NODE_404_length_9277_cov_0.359407.p8 type:complete len:112 gc:universal NODE_404_length_9277_cov_0.359407:6305-5970(-)
MNLLFILSLFALPAIPYRKMSEAVAAISFLSLMVAIPISAYQAAVYGTRYIVGGNTSSFNHNWASSTPLSNKLAEMNLGELQTLMKSNPTAANSLLQSIQPMTMATSGRRK